MTARFDMTARTHVLVIAHARDTTLFVTLRLFPARGWLQWLLGVIYDE